MLRFLLLAAICSEPFVSVFLAASEDSAKWPAHGPRPSFTSCRDCTEVRYEVATRSGTARIPSEPLLRIHGQQVARSEIIVETALYEPERFRYLLLLYPDDRLAAEIEKVADEHWNDRVVVFTCKEVIQAGWMSPRWKRNIPVGVFESEDGALSVATRLKLSPAMVAFDPGRDEARRVRLLRSMFTDYASKPDGKQQIERQEPDLHDFLKRHPEYWKLFDEEKESARR